MFKKFLSAVISTVTVISFIPQIPAKAEETENEPYPYTLFAGSKEDGSITINSNNICINGNIATNGTISSSAQNFCVNGLKEEHSNHNMVYLFDKIDTSYFSSDNVESYLEDYYLDATNIDINNPLDITGSASMTGNINIKTAFRTTEDINLYGEVKNTENSVIFSEYGDINIESTNVNINGLIYAPFGNVNLKANNLNINSVVIVADTITITAPNLNCNNNIYFSNFMSSKSEDSPIIVIDKKEMDYISDEDVYYPLSSFNAIKGTLGKAEKMTSFEITVFDILGNQIFYKQLLPETNWCVNDIGLMAGINEVVLSAIDSEGQKYTKNVKLLIDNTCFLSNLQVDLDDNDNDGLWNYMENYFGTDPDIPDTDGDGLNDYIEILSLGYDPLKVDSDDNGVSDGEEDADSDGLSNLLEVNEFGSNPIFKDTDHDGLWDQEEYEFGTSPILKDTDEDGISDYDEYYLFNTNPLEANSPDMIYTKKYTAEDCMVDYDKGIYPTITFTGDAEAIKTFSIEECDRDMYINPSMVGYLGSAYDFSTEGEFGSATLTFTYDPELLFIDDFSEEAFLPTIYYFNEETCELEELENQIRVGNTVTAELQHFSKYMLLNKVTIDEFIKKTAEFLTKKTGKTIDQPLLSNEPIDIVFMIQSAGYYGEDLFNTQKKVIHQVSKYVLSKYEDIRIHIQPYNMTTALDFVYPDDTTYLTKIEDVDETLKNLSYSSSSASNRDSCYWKINKLFNSNVIRKDCKSFIYNLSNDPTNTVMANDRYYLENYVHNHGAIYSQVIIDKDYSELEPVSSYIKETLNGFDFHYENNLDELVDTIKIHLDQLIELKLRKSGIDANKDGIDDYYEFLMCEGLLTTKTGTRVFSGASYEEVMANNDFDGDGLINGDEVWEYTFFSNYPCIMLKSDPTTAYTDKDYYSDYEEYINGTNPRTLSVIVSADDYHTIYQNGRFMCAEAAAEYADASEIKIGFDYFVDVVCCNSPNLFKILTSERGNEQNLIEENERYLGEYLSFMIDNSIDDSFDLEVATQSVDGYKNLLQLIDENITVKITDKVKLGKAREKLKDMDKLINSLKSEIAKGVRTKKFDLTKKEVGKIYSELDKEMNVFKSEYAETKKAYDETMGKAQKRGGKIGKAIDIGLLVVQEASIIKNVRDYTNQLTSYIQFKDLVNELSQSDIDIFAEAASNVYGDIVTREKELIDNNIITCREAAEVIYETTNMLFDWGVDKGIEALSADVSGVLTIIKLSGWLLAGQDLEINRENLFTADIIRQIAHLSLDHFDKISVLKTNNNHETVFICTYNDTESTYDIAKANRFLCYALYARKYGESKYLTLCDQHTGIVDKISGHNPLNPTKQKIEQAESNKTWLNKKLKEYYNYAA